MNKERYWIALENSSFFVYEYYGMVWIENVLVSKEVKDFENVIFFNLGILDNDFWLVGPTRKNRSMVKSNFEKFEDLDYYCLAAYVDYTYRRYVKITIL